MSHLSLVCSSESIVFLYLCIFNHYCFKLSAAKAQDWAVRM